MTTIRTTCDRCGDVELTIRDVGLELEAEGTEGSYRFDCPFCGTMQRKPASQRVVSILLATGVSYEIVTARGPITEAEITRFTKALDREDWFIHLVSSGS